ncbi:MAG: M24 family metallopeptidase [Rubrobacteraceae bacterium]
MSREARHEKLRELMDRRGFGALLLQRPANFAWYTNGADNRVDHADPLGVAALLFTADDEYILTDNIEAPRMRGEETPDFEVLEHPWYGDPSDVIKEVAGETLLGVDHPLEGATDVSQDVASLRYVLDDEAIERYRRVGRDANRAVSEAIDSLPNYKIGERQVAARVAESCQRRGLFTPLLMAASEERMMRYRHPILRFPGTALGRMMMVVICAERGGLYANLTRIVLFEHPGEEVIRRQRACENILLRTRDATLPGRTLAEVFEDCKRFYAEEGFPGEWKNHHQGGLTGYGSREVIATPAIDLEIEPGMAFAWNPSLTGAKAEETFILTDSGPEVITGA